MQFQKIEPTIAKKFASALGMTATEDAINKLSGAVLYNKWKPPGQIDLAKREVRQDALRVYAQGKGIDKPYNDLVLEATKEIAKMLNINYFTDPEGRVYFDEQGGFSANIALIKKGYKGEPKFYFSPYWNIVANWNRLVGAAKSLSKFKESGKSLDEIVRDKQSSMIKGAVKRAFLFANNSDYKAYVMNKMGESKSKFAERQRSRLLMLGS